MRLDRSDDVCTFHVDTDANGRPERLDTIHGQLIPTDLVIKVDLAKVQIVTSPDLAHLVELYKDTTKRGKSMILKNVQAPVRKVLSVTRLDQLLMVD